MFCDFTDFTIITVLLFLLYLNAFSLRSFRAMHFSSYAVSLGQIFAIDSTWCFVLEHSHRASHCSVFPRHILRLQYTCPDPDRIISSIIPRLCHMSPCYPSFLSLFSTFPFFTMIQITDHQPLLVPCVRRKRQHEPPYTDCCLSFRFSEQAIPCYNRDRPLITVSARPFRGKISNFPAHF